MDKKDKKNNILRSILFLLVTSFLVLYFSQATGYYEFKEHKKVTFTSEQIKKFEQDVAKGKNINIEDYLKDENKDYNNTMSKLGYNLSKNISKGIKDGIENIFKSLDKIVED